MSIVKLTQHLPSYLTMAVCQYTDELVRLWVAIHRPCHSVLGLGRVAVLLWPQYTS